MPRSRTTHQNPFSTSRVRPGAVRFVFPASSGSDALMRRFDRFRGWGQIVGPHGSGKSTLVHWLCGRVRQMGKPVVTLSLCPDMGPGTITPRALNRSIPGTQVFIDGYDQMTWWRRHRIERRCRRRNLGLIVTTHQSLGLPTLARTIVTPLLARKIVYRILGAAHPAHGSGRSSVTHGHFSVSAHDIDRLLQHHGGNMRETLFSLYDRYEQTRPNTLATQGGLVPPEIGAVQRPPGF